MKKKISIGVLAHVDSGKTTLSEAILYLTGEIRSLGRVDNKDAFLDTNEIERNRGITIFSKQATFSTDATEFTLLDTPGHVDFSAETERVLGVLDYAILLISASDGVQSHTSSLWKVLSRYNVPTFIFVNKMDMSVADRDKLLTELKDTFSSACIDMQAVSENNPDEAEALAVCSERLMSEFFEAGELTTDSIASAIAERKLFPCYFGSALKTDGVSELISALDTYTKADTPKEKFGAKVFKITSDERGNRLTHMKITGGRLCVKDIINEEKVNEIRIYSGLKYRSEQEADSGTICAVSGLTQTFAGQGLGFEQDLTSFTFEPVFSYKVVLDEGYDINTALRNLKKYQEEDPQLHTVWHEQLNEIHIQLMGEIQSEVLKSVLKERFDMNVAFEQGGIIYKETIRNSVLGVGHFEPLRHYAEVHLILEPGKSGSGLVFTSNCSEDMLEKNWQRLILTHLEEKTHLGVLTGSPITDMKITLVAGRAHKKHTEGGDFRQSTYRAVRQGLMQAESVLLEPWYSFTLTVPTASLGRAMTDIQNMGGKFTPPENREDFSVLKGYAPVVSMCNYSADVRAYTHGLGTLECMPAGYEPCKNQEAVVEAMGYDPEQDTLNTPDSVFCEHGAGFVVKWNEVHEHMHIEDTRKKAAEELSVAQNAPKRSSNYADDDELMRIFERTYGKVQRKPHTSFKSQKLPEAVARKYKAAQPTLGEYLLVDGYNVLFAWFDLNNASTEDLDIARNYLINRLSNYREMRSCEIIVVFDAYKVKGGTGSCERVGNLDVVYTKEAETADSYIERTARDISKKNYSVKVATSDRLEQIIIFGSGAFRISADEFLKDIELAEEKLESIMSDINTNERLTEIKIPDLEN